MGAMFPDMEYIHPDMKSVTRCSVTSVMFDRVLVVLRNQNSAFMIIYNFRKIYRYVVFLRVSVDQNGTRHHLGQASEGWLCGHPSLSSSPPALLRSYPR